MKPYRKLRPDKGGATLYAPAPIPREELSLVIQRFSSKMDPNKDVFSSDPIKGSSVFSQEAAVGSSNLPLDTLRWA